MTDGLAALWLGRPPAGPGSGSRAWTGSERERARRRGRSAGRGLVRRWPALERRGCRAPTSRCGRARRRCGGAFGSGGPGHRTPGRRRGIRGHRRAGVGFAAGPPPSGSAFLRVARDLADSAPPFVVATYYTSNGELDVEAVTEDLLAAAARRMVAGVHSCRWPMGTSRSRTPNRLCGPGARCSRGMSAAPGPRTPVAPGHPGIDRQVEDGSVIAVEDGTHRSRGGRHRRHGGRGTIENLRERLAGRPASSWSAAARGRPWS